MSFIYHVQGTYDLEDPTKVDVADGVYETLSMIVKRDFQFATATFQIVFYDANDNIVTPTAGTVNPQGQPIKGQWMQSGSATKTIDATTAGENATYEMPSFLGPMISGRMTLSGITGAAYCRATFWRGQ